VRGHAMRSRGGPVIRVRSLAIGVVIALVIFLAHLHSLVPHPHEHQTQDGVDLRYIGKRFPPTKPESAVPRAEPASKPLLDVATTHCDHPYGSYAQYWKVVPEDIEPSWEEIVRDHRQRRYLTYEPDHGGFNNIRMGMEIFALLALSTGRTLVLPPSESFYLLHRPMDKTKKPKGVKSGPKLGFSDFFDLKRLSHQGSVIGMEEFLRREAATGRFSDMQLPNNDTSLEGKALWAYMREASPFSTSKHKLHPGKHILAVAPGAVDVPGDDGNEMSVMDAPQWRIEQMKKFAKSRQVVDLLSDPRTKDAMNWHFAVDPALDLRWLSHAYTVLWWSDPVQERFWRRFQRDGLRYRDEIICACAKAVKHLREIGGGSYASYHIRRGDFQFEKARIPIEEIVQNTRANLREGELVYIATDERNAAAFAPFTSAGYRVMRLDDVADLIGLGDLANPNWIGMIEQVISSQGRVFHGTYWSTFTGFIMRMRGYMGWGDSNFYCMSQYLNALRKPDDKYNVEGGAGWWREWKIAWEDIDEPFAQLPK